MESNTTITIGSNSMAKDTDFAAFADDVHSLLRGELSAIEAYVMVLESLDNQVERDRVMEFLLNHQEAANYWTSVLVNQSIKPDSSSGPWGQFVKAFTASAKLLGNPAALEALKQGEEHGLNEYESALENGKLTRRMEQVVRDKFIPLQRRHIMSIESMKALR